MLNMFLTKYDGAFLGPIAKALGKIMEWLYSFFDMMGIANIGLCIIAFVIVVKLILLPFTIKQQKFTKVSAIMNPELQAVQKKYKDKKDQDSIMKMREETNAIYEKYGTSPTGSCLPMLIQMPILFALYRVILNIPAYVPQIKNLYMNIVNSVGESNLITFLDDEKVQSADSIIDKLTSFGPDNWNKLKETFAASSDVIIQNQDKIDSLNSFLGINLSQSPISMMGFALIIPIMSALAQWYSTKLMTSSQQTSMEGNPMGSSMKVMNMTMPIISGVICLTMPAGAGLYWIMGSVIQVIQQIAINAYFKKADINDIIKKNIEKKNKKRAKKGLPPQKVTNIAHVNAKNIESKVVEQKSKVKDNKEEQIKKSTEYYSKGNQNTGSIASKANMVKMYNEKNDKKNDKKNANKSNKKK